MAATREHPLWANLFRPRANHRDRVIELWRQTPLFAGIPPRKCREVADEMHTRHFQAEEPIFQAGDSGAGALLIVDGAVSIRSGGQTLAELGAGDFFGEVALVSDEARTADAVAREPTEVVFLLKPNLEEWIQRSPRHGARMMGNLARVLASRLSNANELLSRHGAGDA